MARARPRPAALRRPSPRGRRPEGPSSGPIVATLASVLALLVAGLAAGAEPASAPSAGWTVERSHTTIVWNCSGEHSLAPRSSRAAGVGGWRANASVRACPPSLGGPSADSYAFTSAALELRRAVALNASDRGVRVSWGLDLNASVAATMGPPVNGCPFYATHYVFANATGLYYYNFEYQWCDVEAVVSVGATAELVDRTTGAVTLPSHAWSGIQVDAGRQIITYGYFGNYSNPRYWHLNYTTWWSMNYSFGAASSLATNATPAWYLNGSFSAQDRYVLQTVLTESIATESFQFHRGRASAVLDALGGGRFEDAGPVVVY